MSPSNNILKMQSARLQ